MALGVTCPKCGLIQLPGPRCRSCGAALGASATPLASRPDMGGIRTPSAPPAKGQTAGESGQIRRLSFHGSGLVLFGIHLVNSLLIAVTLGIYYFWGRVRIRRYLFEQSELEGDRFAYHGTGRELLIGFTKAFVLFWVPFVLLSFLPISDDWGPLAGALLSLLPYGVPLVLIPVVMVGARRYRLSRTSWRGIRFSFRGRTSEFVALFFGGLILTVLTLGAYYPFFETRRHGFMVSHSRFGNRQFAFTGKGSDLFRGWLLTLLLILPTLGLYWFWFLARKQRYFWEQTACGAVRFRYPVTGGRLLALQFGNLLLLVLTLGLAWPLVVVRNLQFTFHYLTIEGPLDLESIQQDAQDASATGEAIEGFLDGGFDLG